MADPPLPHLAAVVLPLVRSCGLLTWLLRFSCVSVLNISHPRRRGLGIIPEAAIGHYIFGRLAQNPGNGISSVCYECLPVNFCILCFMARSPWSRTIFILPVYFCYFLSSASSILASSSPSKSLPFLLHLPTPEFNRTPVCGVTLLTSSLWPLSCSLLPVSLLLKCCFFYLYPEQQFFFFLP